ncbi:MAG: hypothetical protein RLO81_03940 [Fulvivirga sp.]|uniref:hypothetical protein n=1 Tax=Fulvivirga sp. TaxID=1931237 RepID=UPI0032EBCCE2
MKIINLLILFVFIGLAACSEDDAAQIPNDKSSLLQTGQGEFNDVLDDIKKGEKTSDSFTIFAVKVENNILLIDVGYAGGCETHEFELIWPEVIITIYPYQFGVILNHNANGDLCEAFIKETLSYDLTDNPLGLNDQSIQDMKITIINGSDPDNAVSNRE